MIPFGLVNRGLDRTQHRRTEQPTRSPAGGEKMSHQARMLHRCLPAARGAAAVESAAPATEASAAPAQSSESSTETAPETASPPAAARRARPPGAAPETGDQ